ncbi:hypothetical protein [Spiroplasma endosymbiont of Nebria brevicollis]|uniref:hypothetical protein n=1 Tax=Spiroplasma endosymbiont of Nebria brevicollis TaxID=3066284 RepID=UPI00313CC4FA
MQDYDKKTLLGIDTIFINEQTEKLIFMKDLLLNKVDIVKKEFEKTMLKTRNARKQTW